MQKLERRNTYTPTDTPRVRSNCDVALNKEETLSVQGLKTLSNNLEVDQPQQRTGGLKAIVYVISKEGEVLMPCKPAKARKLLLAGKAKIVKMHPFVIQLTFECDNQVQDVSLGVDSGYGNIGFSAVSEKRELISGTVVLDDKTSARLTEKSMYRRGRRNKLWYRKPRFLNRGKAGSLPPSVKRRYDAHLKLIREIKAVLPVSKTTIEVANFDIQKIENPDISGKEYQQGDMYGYQNMRSYLMAREKGKCQLCKKEFTKGQPSHIHHVIERGKQGSDRAKNLAILHKKCHDKLHKKGLKLSPPKQYKPNTFMSIIHKRFKKDIPNINVTFGYITFIERNKIGLEKTHYNDAFVIAGGCTQERLDAITIRQKHRNNRAIQLNRKGFKPSIRKRRYAMQPKDFIWIDGQRHIVSGVHCKGSRVMVEGKKGYSVKKVEKTYHFGSFAYN